MLLTVIRVAPKRSIKKKSAVRPRKVFSSSNLQYLTLQNGKLSCGGRSKSDKRLVGGVLLTGKTYGTHNLDQIAQRRGNWIRVAKPVKKHALVLRMRNKNVQCCV